MPFNDRSHPGDIPTQIANVAIDITFFHFIKCFTAQMLKVCSTPGPTACLKILNKVCSKSREYRKNSHNWATLNLQLSDLRLNAYRSLPGGQVFSPCYFHVLSLLTFLPLCPVLW